MKERKWFLCTLTIIGLMIGSVALLNFIIDPYFHYRKPNPDIAYRIYEERYVNDGILRHFEYDSIIIGTSMTQNFKTSEFETLFSGKAVKVPFAGAGFQELSDTLSRAFEYNPDVRLVLRGVDYRYLLEPFDYTNYEDYPAYMYDDNPWNDASYLLNKSVLFHDTLYAIIATIKNEEMTSFDEYAAWQKPTGEEVLLQNYYRRSKKIENVGLSPEEEEQVRKTVEENLLKVAIENSDVEFYLFYTPYSIIYWDQLDRDGRLIKQLEADRIATEMLTECENIKLYSFYLNEELVNDLNNYTDIGHYSGEINSQILKWIRNGEGLITKDNRDEYLRGMNEYYINFDYKGYFENK